MPRSRHDHADGESGCWAQKKGEAGHVTKDLAVLIGPDQPWMNTNQFLDKLDQNLKAKMGA